MRNYSGLMAAHTELHPFYSIGIVKEHYLYYVTFQDLFPFEFGFVYQKG